MSRLNEYLEKSDDEIVECEFCNTKLPKNKMKRGYEDANICPKCYESESWCKGCGTILDENDEDGYCQGCY